jgi:hypothetical protein
LFEVVEIPEALDRSTPGERIGNASLIRDANRQRARIVKVNLLVRNGRQYLNHSHVFPFPCLILGYLGVSSGRINQKIIGSEVDFRLSLNFGQVLMAKKLPTILPLAAAIAALQGLSAITPTPAAASTTGIDETNATRVGPVAKAEPNVFMSIGGDLFGLIVTKGADGTVVADHYSHSSHSSHSSHHSHYSSR